MSLPKSAGTGLPGLDQVVHNLRLGDNVVWQVDDILSYRHFVEPYIVQAKREGRKIIYVRFAAHAPLLKPEDGVKIAAVEAEQGFESFSKQIHEIITREGVGAFYVFDCLSDLLSAWATDLMIGNFFVVTCPYLFQLDTVAYFALQRGSHSFKTIAHIRETTQLLLDVYNFEDNYYVHPLKVWERHSPTMFLPHLQKAGQFIPLTNSADATRLFAFLAQESPPDARRNLDYWDRLFLRAEELAGKKGEEAEKRRMLVHLCKIMLGKEPRMKLAT